MTQTCWICGATGTTRKHKAKRDLKAVFGWPTQAAPIFVHARSGKNRQVKSIDAKVFKSPFLIREFCNSTRTQPHDQAWETICVSYAASEARSASASCRFLRAGFDASDLSLSVTSLVKRCRF
jgi:hypothetical protein